MRKFFKFASMLAVVAMLSTVTPAISQTGTGMGETTTQDDRNDDDFDYGWLGLLGLLGLFGLRHKKDHNHDVTNRTTTTR